MAGQASADAPIAQRRAKQMHMARAQFTMLPREAVQGYPVPLMVEGELWFVFPFVYRSGRPPEPPELTAPIYMSRIDASTGERAEIRAVEGADPEQRIGQHVIDKKLSYDDFLQAEADMFAAMSALLDVARYPDRALTAEEAEAAKAFAASWPKVAHRPLAAHYRAINPAWFAKVLPED
ncbi:hypothetical protein IV417_02985 [Alphaproteobacteria bacterium KMM 3653]|uniref:Uncharacterized protein n=1 Tax=Harenicola maris TaxID=2841044 RepID=A0AAP2CMK8_9RHOB|nr:hypothetical protein [Harenicola maris]